MIRSSFNLGWTYSDEFSALTTLLFGSKPQQDVNLPHDAMILGARDRNSPKGSAGGFFCGGAYTYVKSFFVPGELAGSCVGFEFEGVYMHAKVYINDCLAQFCPNGYSMFYVSAEKYLKCGEMNTIRVVAKTAVECDSRWYTGGGIYRDVKMLTANLLHIAPVGAKLSTPEISDVAVIETAIPIEYSGTGRRDAEVVTEIRNAAGEMAVSERVGITVFGGESFDLRQRLYIDAPCLWSPDEPNLYTYRITITEHGKEIDSDCGHFGVRSLALDSRRGLQINGKTVKLRGACVHHDNGLLGACSYEAAEKRRIQILKNSGFNAIRSAHNQISKLALDACDRLGMLVMDEAFDEWGESKTCFGYSDYFEDHWERDMKAMIDKDFNHPSVILYSLGNEIPETGSVHGAALARRINEKCKALDSTRYTLNSINAVLSVLPMFNEIVSELKLEDRQTLQNAAGDTMEINTLMNNAGAAISFLTTHELTITQTEQAYAATDIAGYNYMGERYEMDAARYPNRIIIGSETTTPKLAEYWQSVEKLPSVLGDFCWTGWDYIGEAGVGKNEYDAELGAGMYGEYPWYISYCGDIDICGERKPQSYWREIVWGLRKSPYISVRRPEHRGKKPFNTKWSWSDSISCWTFRGFEGETVEVEVYSDSDEVELIVNGKAKGKKSAGKAVGFITVFEVEYEAGEICAVSCDGESFSIKTAVEGLRLIASADKSTLAADGNDLSYITLSLTDDAGVLNMSAQKKITAKLEGDATLIAFGSADPKSEENFFDTVRTTYLGKALAIVRAGANPGSAKITFSADGCEDASVEIIIG